MNQNDIDVMHEEFLAMTDASLGPNYDKAKLELIARLQINLNKLERQLFKDYDENKITASAYVDALNDLADKTFAECENILGPQDFEQLFGAPLSERLWHLDKDMFLNSHRQ